MCRGGPCALPGGDKPLRYADGRWIAFWSTESDDAEVYIMPFPGPGKIQQASIDGGTWSAWPKNGTELIYVLGGGLLRAVEIDYTGDTIEIGATRDLLQSPSPKISGWDFAPTPDGERLLVISGGDLEINDSLELFVNWPGTLADR